MAVGISALLTAFIAVVLMASVPIVVKLVSASEIEVGTLRLLIASVGMTLWLKWSRVSWRLTADQWRMLILLGITFAIHWYAYFKSIKLSTPSIAAIGVSTYGIHLVLLSAIFLKQKINVADGVALVLAMVGVYLVIPDLDWQSDYFQGLLVSIFSGILYACLPIIHQLGKEVPNRMRAWGQFSFALMVFLPFGLFESWQLGLNDWVGLVFLGVVATLIAHSLWVKATTELPGAIASMVYYLYVPLAMALSYVLVDEQITGLMILGAALIILANFLTIAYRFYLSRRGTVQ